MPDEKEDKKDKSQKVLEAAISAYKADKDHWEHIFRAAEEDLFFLSDDPMAQWEAADHKSRTDSNRPAITVDMMGQFIHQVVNDIKMNTPTINVIPSGGEADIESAEIFKGLIRNIEYVSAADDAYDNAVNYSVKCSIGYIRVDHDYVDDQGFDQELKIDRVINPTSVYLDKNSNETDGSDAKRCTIVDEMTVATFKKRWPGKEVASFDEGPNGRKTDYEESEKIIIAEQFIIEESDKTIALDESGDLVDYSEGQEYAKTRTVKEKKIVRRKMSGKDILEETTFPGKYIPLIPVYGEEAWYQGKRFLHSLIRKAKPAQQMFNFWKSLETELLMKQPQSPFIAAAGSVEEYGDDWQNPAKASVLRYDHLDEEGNPYPAPRRESPPIIPAGVVNASNESVDNIKATMGIYNAALGARSNETSGVAINQRKLEGDVAVYHFGDNLTKSITHVGRVLVNAIPEIYDTQRVLRIIGEEDEPKMIGVNGAMSPEGQDRPFDLRQGKYDVKVMTGAAFTTRRQETAAALAELFGRQPELMQIMGDLYFKNSDFTGAEALAKRMEKVIDPKLLEEEDGEDQQIQQMQAQFEEVIQALQGELQAAQAELQSKQQDLAIKAQGEQTKAQIAQGNNEIKAAELRIKEAELQLEEATKAAELEIKRRELDLKEQEMQVRAELEALKVSGELQQGQEELELEEQRIAQQEFADANTPDDDVGVY